MKTRLSILFMFLLALAVFGQGGPIWRNSWTTNQAPPVRGTNLGVTNTASGFMWKFYGWPDSNMVARLGDVSNIVGSSSAAITNAVASVWTNGVAVVASGATNIEFFGVVASNTPVGQIGNVRVWIQPSSGTNVNFFFVTNGMYASNVFATNISVDTFYVNTEMQLSNALRVPFGGTGTNTNALGSFYIGNGTNCAQWLNTNVFANWLSNQIGVAPTGDFIFKSNGFGTNLSLLGYFSVSTTGLFVTNWAGTYARVGVNTNSPRATLHVNVQHPIFCGFLVASNGWNGTSPTMIITNGFVGIGRHDPRQALDLRGNTTISGSISVTNGIFAEGGIASFSGLTNVGTAVFTNDNSSANRTTLAINTNGAGGIAVLHIAAGTNGSPIVSHTNQYVILYTNVMYGAGFAVETNGRVTANTFVGAGISAQGLTVTTNGTDYISTTNLYFIGQPKITNASGDVSIDITPGAASGAFVLNSNGFGTNLVVYNLSVFSGASFSNILTVYDVDNGNPLFVADMTEGVQIVDFEGGTERWIFGTNADNPQMPLRRLETTNITLANITNYGTLNINTNGGLAVLHILAGTNMAGIQSTQQYVFMYTNGGYAKGIMMNTNGNVSASGNINAGADITSFNSVNAGQYVFVGGTAAFTHGSYQLRFGNTSTSGGRIGMPALGLFSFDGGSSGAFGSGIQVFDSGLWAPSATILSNKWLIGSTNRNLTVCTSTNGTNRSDMFGINPSNIWVQTQQVTNNVSGQLPGQPIVCYGALMMSDTNLLAVGAAYTNVQNFNVANTNMFNGNLAAGTLTNIFAGFYKCTVTVSMTGAAAELYEGCLLTNGVDSELISWQKEFAPGTARRDAMSANGIIYLPANTGCSFGIKNITSAGNISIHRASITIGTP